MDVLDGLQHMWSTKEISSNVGEGMDIPEKVKTTRGAEQASFSFVLYKAAQQVWPRLMVYPPTSKDLNLKFCLLISNDLIKKKRSFLKSVSNHLGFS